ncbi:glutathione peroxidase [Teredinibacter purpureus]|uniref:glutathione peroxidase n=1 Tax=Teredinibacter purpureus TaxID=2731756 RepID=UPI0005F87BCF|nr:glutathione peroxidase [Teredinibacter purpureus]
MTRLQRLFFALTLSIAPSVSAADAPQAEQSCPALFDHAFKKLHSNDTLNLCDLYTGKPMILINTASHCGYTRQFKGLEALYQKYKKEGVELVGFASDDFKQAAKSEMEAASICYKNYGVTFSMIAPTHVRGDDANEVFTRLNRQAGKPSWNFNKYLVSADGSQIQRFGSNTEPTDSALEKALIKAL